MSATISPTQVSSSDHSRSDSSTVKDLRISIGTFNVCGQAPGDIDLEQWLHIVRDEPDILVVGLEEAEISNLSYVLWSPVVEDSWSAAVEMSMGSNLIHYEKLTSKQLVGTLMLVYIRKEMASRISSVAASSVGVGFGGWAANKGATAVRFELKEGFSICFVVSHLSAFDTVDARDRRRWDYSEIVKRMRFTIIESDNTDTVLPVERNLDDDKFGEVRTQVRDAEAMLRAQLKKEAYWNADERGDSSWRDDIKRREMTIMDHDIVFWAGDLNFRLELGIGEVKRLIEQQQYESVLLNFDQLRSEMQAQTAFQGFQEQKIEFAPTYKFDRGTEVYDTSEKQRVPSWTDRILWKQDKDLVQPLHYESCPSISISDHKPVLAAFFLKCRQMDTDKDAAR